MLINSIAQYITRDKLKGAAKKRKKKPSLAVAVAGGVPPEAQITNYNPQTTNADTETAGISQNVNADAGTVGRGLAPAVVGGGPSGAPQISASQLQSAPQGPPRPQPLISSGDKAGRRASPRATQRAAKVIIWAAAVLVLAVLIAIIVYLLIMGVPELTWEFLTQNPRDMGREGGVAATIVSTFVVTGLALLISIPFGIGSAFYLAEYTKENIWTRVIRFSVESLAGIPSIVYGLFGFIIFVSAFGFSALSGGLTLAIMVLPTVIRTSEEAIKTVPNSYRETSFSLGASKWQTVLYAVFPTALRGIVNGVILGIGRCVAETAAVILTAGSALRMRTMASHFFILADEGISMEKAYGTAALLIILILIINVGFNALLNRFVGRDARATKKGKKRLLKAG
ncbi:MAG: phosphate ABC transporter permease PstA [Firmicutes bacterium]|nr:phosphate ABC transporter permease PstA [Bacillota bacterium]